MTHHHADITSGSGCPFAAEFMETKPLERTYGPPLYEADDGTTRRAGLVVMGMGKLGGEELNFASDIDVIYLYTSDQGAAGSLTLHEYFDRLARKLTRTIGSYTE